MVKAITQYICEICKTSYPSEDLAQSCESQVSPVPIDELLTLGNVYLSLWYYRIGRVLNITYEAIPNKPFALHYPVAEFNIDIHVKASADKKWYVECEPYNINNPSFDDLVLWLPKEPKQYSNPVRFGYTEEFIMLKNAYLENKRGGLSLATANIPIEEIMRSEECSSQNSLTEKPGN